MRVLLLSSVIFNAILLLFIGKRPFANVQASEDAPLAAPGPFVTKVKSSGKLFLEEAGRGNAHSINVPPPPTSFGEDPNRAQSMAAELLSQGWSLEQARAFAIGRLFEKVLQEHLSYRDRREYWEPIPHHDRRDLIQSTGRATRIISRLMDLEGGNLLNLDTHAIPLDKVVAIARIEDDYRQMSLEFVPPGDGIELPEDKEAHARLKREAERDIKAMLSPDELREYQRLKAAATTRSRLAFVDLTEEELAKLVEIQRKMTEAEGARDGESVEEISQRTVELRQASDTQWLEILGEERFRQVERHRSGDYRQLLKIARRLEIPIENINRVHDRMERAPDEWNAMGDERSAGRISSRELLERRKATGRELRKELRELLGDDGLKLYEQHGRGILGSYPREKN